MPAMGIPGVALEASFPSSAPYRLRLFAHGVAGVFGRYTEKTGQDQLRLDSFREDQLWYLLAFVQDSGIFLKMH
jgi:hypothetical protein